MAGFALLGMDVVCKDFWEIWGRLLEGSADINSIYIPALKIIEHCGFLIDMVRSFLQFSSLSSVMCSGLARSGSTGHSLHLTMQHASSSFDFPFFFFYLCHSCFKQAGLLSLLAVSLTGQFSASSTPLSNISQAFQQHF